ncbi:trafficking protein particle complex subunit 5-like isoform X2 [Dysidea avara]|uniref:trafficking protein particle complex subunit 5-like isoform X2 n=1 Tax=Dysidea avara TaxID=196820 RepID=UPI00332E1F4A
MDRSRTKNVTVFDKSLATRGKSEVNLSTFAFLFSELVQYNHQRVASIPQLQERLAELGQHIGHRMVDVLCWRDRATKRETRLVNMLLFIKNNVWKTLFGKEADSLEQATDVPGTYYLFEEEPLVNTFISVPNDFSGLNCAAFGGGVVEAFLSATQFPAKVQTFWHGKQQNKTAIRIQFEDSVLLREKMMEK